MRFRLFSDAARYRLGTNYDRDGQMRFGDNGGGSVNYEPNSFGGSVEDPSVKEPPLKISGHADRYDHRIGNDDYRQPGDLFRWMNAAQQAAVRQHRPGNARCTRGKLCGASSATSPGPIRRMRPAWRKPWVWRPDRLVRTMREDEPAWFAHRKLQNMPCAICKPGRGRGGGLSSRASSA